MSGVLDFLFDGQPPKSITTTGSTTSAVPQWMTDYTKGILARANQEAAVGYQPYQGARIASFTPTQQAAFDLTKSNVGSANPAIQAGINIAGNMPGQGALEQAMNYLPDTAQKFPDAADQYMNPYIKNVTDRAHDLALQTYNESIAPNIEGQFARNGILGSSAQIRALERGARDVTGNLQSQADASLADAWKSSADIFNADQSRQGQLAQIAGQLGATQSSVGLNTANTLANLGTDQHAINAQDAAALEAVGGEQQGQTQKNLDLAYQDFLNQQGYNKSQIDWLSNLMSGSTGTVPKTTDTSATGPAAKYGPSGLAQIAAIISAWKGLSDNGD